MPKRKCVFNANLELKYKFIKKTTSNSDVICNVCQSKFSIAHSGAGDIDAHVLTATHQKALGAVATSRPITSFFQGASAVDLKVAALEGLWTYHTIDENHSFNSTSCASKIFRTAFDISKFRCSRTKCEAIVTNVFGPAVEEMLKEELAQCRFVTLLTDASNHGAVKMFPVMVRYFLPTDGVKVRILNITSENGETGELIFNVLKKTWETHDLGNKMVGFCADNAPTNFGTCERTGEKNVFARLQQVMPHLVGIGCTAHIGHNALQVACDQMNFDVELIVVKIYSHFYRYTVRTAALKDFCESVGDEYCQLLGYGKTRFLALRSCIDSIIRIFNGLKEFFHNSPVVPKVLKEFFENPMAKFWLIFVRDQVIMSLSHWLSFAF